MNKLSQKESDFILDQVVDQIPESISYIQTKFSISKNEAYDICMLTFLDLRKKMLQNKIKPGNLRFLFTRMCINKFLDEKKKENKIKKAIHVYASFQENEVVDKEKVFILLDRAINHLSENQKKLLHQLYYSKMSLQEIACENDISYSNIRKKKERLLATLKKYYFEVSESKLKNAT